MCVVDEGEFVAKKEMDQLNLQYNQLCDNYKAVKGELEATQEENRKLKEQLKQSNFGFDSIKDTNSKICFFYRFAVIAGFHVAVEYCKKKHTCAEGWVKLGEPSPFGSNESPTWTHQQRHCLQIWASILNCIKNLKTVDSHVILNIEPFDNVAE